MIRKITTPEENAKKESRRKIIISVILAVIMLFSTAGYFIFDFSGSSSKSTDYNSIKFTQSDYGYWAFSYGGHDYGTLYNPVEIENASINVQTTKKLADFTNQPLYFSAEPIDDLSQSISQEIIKNIGKLTSRTNFACLDENCTQDYPIKSCSSDNMIIFRKSQTNSSSITDNSKCTIIEYGPEEEKTADAFLFRIIGIK